MKLFVWDFHGVLEKGNDDAVLEITNLALKQHGHSRQMTPAENLFLSGQRWHEYFTYLLPDVEQEECLNLQTTCFSISQNQPEIVARHIQLNDHADFVLETIQNTEHCQILISNTLPQALDMFVKIVGIEKYFPPKYRFGVDTHNQKNFTKKSCLEKYLQKAPEFEAIISIGDSPSDMALVDQESNGIGYLYSHPSKQHRSAKCHYKIDDLRLVLQEVALSIEGVRRSF